jgi:hypothetical protein
VARSARCVTGEVYAARALNGRDDVLSRVVGARPSEASLPCLTPILTAELADLFRHSTVTTLSRW